MGVRRCLARSLTSLTLLRTPKSANGPRSNSFRPDSPSTTNLPRGRKTQAEVFAAPDMVRSGRVLPTSVKSPIYCTVNQMTLVHMVFSREVFSCAFCTKLPGYTEALRACLSRLKKRPGRLFPICLVFFFC